MNENSFEADMVVYNGYTRRQLTDAFELVKPAENWKMPVDAMVPAGTSRLLVTSAIIFFTGSIPSYRAQPDGSLIVVADGYYRAVGA